MEYYLWLIYFNTFCDYYLAVTTPKVLMNREIKTNKIGVWFFNFYSTFQIAKPWMKWKYKLVMLSFEAIG